MDAVFKALADSSRRLLLDSLFARDGQSLTELCAPLAMSRYGVMKHLAVLEAAGLVTTRRVGREKLHYLNPVPIRLLADRWIGKYAEPWVRAMADLKSTLEEPMGKPRHVYEIYIRTTPEQLWEAITSPEFTRRYFHNTSIESDWQPGSPVVYWMENGESAMTGEVLEADPPRRLVTTWSFRYDPELAEDPSSRVSWEIEPQGEVCKLTLVHDEFASETRTFQVVGPGWNAVLSSLKSLLETGEPLAIAG